MSSSLAYKLEGEDRARFRRYELARSFNYELLKGAEAGQTVEQLAKQYGLRIEDVQMVLYGATARATTRH